MPDLVTAIGLHIKDINVFYGHPCRQSGRVFFYPVITYWWPTAQKSRLLCVTSRREYSRDVNLACFCENVPHAGWYLLRFLTERVGAITSMYCSVVMNCAMRYENGHAKIWMWMMVKYEATYQSSLQNETSRYEIWSFHALKTEAVCSFETFVSPTSVHGITAQKTTIEKPRFILFLAHAVIQISDHSECFNWPIKYSDT
jgi:hypothetical protein